METKRKYVVAKLTYTDIECDNDCLEKELMRELGTFDSEEDVKKAIESVSIQPDFGYHLELTPFYIDVEGIDEELYDVEDDDGLFTLFDEGCFWVGDWWRRIDYDYKSIEGDIIAFWSWQTYIGYCRKIEDVRTGWHDETEKLFVEKDKTYSINASRLAKKEELEGLTLAEVRDLLTDRLHEKHWKWRNEGMIPVLIDHCLLILGFEVCVEPLNL